MQFARIAIYQVAPFPGIALYPVAAVGVVTGASLAAQASGLVPSPYMSAYAVTALLVANRVCLCAGILCGLLAACAFNVLFSLGYGWNHPTPGEITAYITMFAAMPFVAPRKAPAAVAMADGQDYSAAHDLPFTNPAARLCWDVAPSGNWEADCAVGDEYGRIFLERVKAGQPRPLMCWIVRDMISRPGARYTGIEAGFIQHVARASAASLARPRQ
jgi:hypothetical protein